MILQVKAYSRIQELNPDIEFRNLLARKMARLNRVNTEVGGNLLKRKIIQQELSVMTGFLNYTTDIIQELEDSNLTLSAMLNRERGKSMNLEAIALIHGITDLSDWLKRASNIADATTMLRLRCYRLPYALRSLNVQYNTDLI
jgi:hypothetical protein